MFYFILHLFIYSISATVRAAVECIIVHASSMVKADSDIMRLILGI